MPAQKAKTETLQGLFGSKLDGIHKEVKGEETKVNDFGDLPPGIEDGRAQLTSVKIGKFATGDNKGKPFFSAQATVISPKKYMNTSVNGTELGMVKCEGRLTRLRPEPMCDTPKARGRKTLKEHLSWVENILRILGVETASLKNAKEIDAAIAQLNKDQPIISFRTWRGRATKAFPNPGVNHTWLGLADVEEEQEEEDEVQEADDAVGATEEEEETDDTEEEEASDDETEETEEEEAEEGDDEAEDEAPDLDALAEAADDNNDDEAIAKLKELAKEAGIPTKQVSKAKKWADVAAMLKEKAGGEEESEEESSEEEGETEETTDEADEGAEGEWVPEVGQLYFYKPKDKATGKPVKKAIECEITEVDEDSKTVKLLNNSDKKTRYAKVPFDKLIGSDD